MQQVWPWSTYLFRQPKPLQATKTSFLKATALGLLCVGIASGSAAASLDHSSQATISLEGLLEQYKSKQSLDAVSSRLREQAQAQIDANQRLFKEPLTLNVESDIGLGEVEERTISAKVTRSLHFGIDAARLRERFASLADAELLDKQLARREQLKDLATLFTSLRLQQSLALIARETSAVLSPLLKRGKIAAARGSLAGLFLRRWQLLLGQVKAQGTSAEESFSNIAELLNEATGAAIPASATKVLVLGLPPQFQSAEYNAEGSMQARSNSLLQKALVAQAAETSRHWQLEAGFGYVRDLSSGRSSLVAEIALPLGVAHAARADVLAIDADRELLAAEGRLTVAAAKHKAAFLAGAVRRRLAAKRLLQERATDIGRLYRDVAKAVASSRAETGEMIENLGELYEARLKAAEADKELEDSIVEHYFFVAGDEL